VIDGSINQGGLGEGTAIGEAVFAGIESIETAAADTEASSDESLGTIVLLSDGDTTVGRTNEEAASAALAAGIPVHTIAFGTDAGTVQDPLGMTVPVPVNEQALEELANRTGGSSLTAASLGELSHVYEELGKAVTVEKEPVEVGDLFTGAAMAMLALAGLGSLAWFGRLP
jgi:Ca-activated chloride channel family protein